MIKHIFIVAVIISTSAASCKKNETPPTCELTTGTFAGRYKITKEEFVFYTSGVATDQTTLLSDCTLSGIYDFKTDGTVSYTESSTCGGDGNGTWNISGNNLGTTFNAGNGGKISGTHTESWDCSKLVVTTLFPSVEYNYRYTLTKQ